jgi:hypothetical protein
MIYVKSAHKKGLPKKPIRKIVFLAKTFFGCTYYYGHMYIFEISTKRRIFDAPFDLFKEKKFLYVGRDFFENWKGQKWKKLLKI